MNTSKVKSYLDSFINFENNLNALSSYEFKLDRMKNLLQALGNPQTSLKVIHVAGSKGKGSVCAMTAQVLKEEGYCVGLYTSPHIENYRERIRVLSYEQKRTADGIFADAISNQELADILTDVQPIIESQRDQSALGCLTFFEAYTAIAFVFFQRMLCDFVVLETGLGGRLDATNAAESLIAVIPSISKEHTHILGDTVVKIAREKAGIIKSKNQRVVLGSFSPDVGDVFQQRCDQFAIIPKVFLKDSQIENVSESLEGQAFDVVSSQKHYQKLFLPLLGEHQRNNAALVIGVVEQLRELGFSIKEKSLVQGLQNVFWPMRFEVVSTNPVVVLDSAHNEDSARQLAKTLKKYFTDRKVILIFGVSEDKNYQDICIVLNDAVDVVITTQANHPRSRMLELEQMKALFLNKSCYSTATIQEALNQAMKMVDDKSMIVVTGSIFLAAQAREILCISTKV